MTLIVPTKEELKARHPEFTSVDDVRIDMFIEEATRSVDESWVEADQKRAIMSLACHLMAMEGEPSKTEAIAAESSDQNTIVSGAPDGFYLKRRTVGDVTNEFAQLNSGSKVSASITPDGKGYSATPYGATFAKLLKLNRSAMRVV